MTTITVLPDVLDAVLGIAPDDRLDRVRRARATTRENAQLSYEAVFAPSHPGGFSEAERFALAYAVSLWHRDEALAQHYLAQLRAHESRAEITATLQAIGEVGATTGPFGSFREDGLRDRDTDGVRYGVDEGAREVLGDELCALIDHAHLLVFRPREASPAALEVLVDAGWTTTDIVTVSQLVAFLSFQIRIAVGLRVLRLTWKETA